MDRNYWVRTEHGRVWGPFTISALERLRGQLTEKCEASLDGKEWLPGADFPELRNLLAPARKVERTATAAPAGPRISRAMAEAFGIGDGARPGEVSLTAAIPDAHSAAEPPPPPPPPPPPRKPPVMHKAPEKLELADSGDLGRISPVRLYALAALSGASGALRLQPEDGKKFHIVFRRGTPEHVSADDPELGLLRFLQGRGVLAADKALAAQEQMAKTGQDALAVLFQLQLIPAADAHRLLGEHGAFLLDRALACGRGSFVFEKDAAPPPGSFPLGARWGLLVESVRHLDVPVLRARLGKRLTRPVVRSGGLGVGKVEELALNAQETRIYAAIDGTKTGEQVLQAHESAVGLRLLYLLTELGHLAFAEIDDDAEASAAAASASPDRAKASPAPATAPASAPAQAKTAATVPPGPARPNRDAPRPPPQRPAAPPVMKAAAPPPKPAAPAVSRPPPAFAQGPADESPEAMLQRLSTLWERVSQMNHFEALGMDRKTATAAETKRNFFVLARELHPDTVTDPAQAALKEVKERLFARINEAAQVIGDDKRRKEYESELDGKAENVDVSKIFAAEENFQRAEILIKARKYQEGLDLLDQAIQMNAEEAEFYALRGYARFLLSKDRKQSFEQCAADCRKAAKMVDRCLPAHLYLGHMAKVVGDLKLAKKCYSRVLELDEKHVEAQRELRLMGNKA